MDFDIVTIILIITLCILCMYTDYQFNIVPNKYLMLLGFPAIIINAIDLHQQKQVDWKLYFLIMVGTILLALLLYGFHIWAAGDCKLFIVIIMAMPYKCVTLFFAGIPLLIWIPMLSFLIGYIVILVESVLISIKKKQKVDGLAKRIASGFLSYLRYYIVVIFFYNVLQAMISKAGIIIHNSWIVTVVLYILVSLISYFKLLESWLVVGCVLCADIIISIVVGESIFQRTTLFIWLAVILTNWLRIVADQYNYKAIRLDEVKKGMIMSSISSLMLMNSKNSPLEKVSDESLKSRLSQEEVDRIITYCNEDKERSKIEITIVKKSPFALFLSLSTCFVIIYGSLL